MTVEHLTIDDLVRVAMCGGGLRISASRISADNLVRIATCASTKGARITIENSAALIPDDMVRIATCGNGCVSFE